MTNFIVPLLIVVANMVGMNYDDSTFLHSYGMRSVDMSSGIALNPMDSNVGSKNFLWTVVYDRVYETIWKSGEMKGVEFGYHPLAAHSFQIGVSAGMVSKREIGIHPRGWSMGARLEHKSGLFAQAMRADGSNNIFVGLRLVTFGSIDASRRPIKLIKRR